MLRVQDINFKLGDNFIVSSLSITVSSGQVVGIFGPNGAGKSTSFRMISGTLKPYAGHIFLDGDDITSKRLDERARLGIGYLPQSTSLLPSVSILDNLKIAAEIAAQNGVDKFDIDEVIEIFGLTRVIRSQARSVSGGERRKAEIARLLIIKPKYMLLDEPFAGVDPISISEIKDIIVSIARRGVGILITDHSVKETLEIIDHAYIMSNGKVIASGGREDIISNEEVKRVYLG